MHTNTVMKYINILTEHWTDTNRLQRVQNSAARLIKHVRRRDHITLILQPLDWMSRWESHSRSMLTCIRLVPDYLNCATACNAPTSALRSASDATLLAVTLARRTVGRSSFAVAGPTMWKSSPKCVRSTETLAAFRKLHGGGDLLTTHVQMHVKYIMSILSKVPSI